jgi:hypothetical protein
MQSVLQPPTDVALLTQLDAILAQVEELRAAIQRGAATTDSANLVAQLSGILGPAASDEQEFFRDNSLDPTRFLS